MRTLNKNCVYDLSELTSEERVEILKETPNFNDKEENYLAFINNDFHLLNKVTFPHSITNAKELFYTLENVQVDCSELTEEQIKEIADVCLKNGYDYYDSEKFALNRSFDSNFLICRKDVFYITNKQGSKAEITYEKFMELFVGNAEETNGMLIKEEKPTQYQMGIDTFTRCESNMTKEEILACCKFNIDKYNWRNKGQDLEDYKKIVSYANWAIKLLKDEK